MHLAALIDLGVPEDWLREQLSRLPVSAEYSLTVQPGSKMGISGTQARVTTTDSHDHRHHSTIVKMIREAGFAAGVERRALAIFAAIAEAEGKIHDVPPEEVHFHEVGAVDSIVDIVAAALCIEKLNPDIVLCNAVEVGSGYVDCAHGRFPVPAPATQELLRGAPCTFGGVDGESTTPTGAAILAATVDEFLPAGTFTLDRVGYGVGHKDFSRPNVLRVAWGEYAASALAVETQYKIEANIDDMTGEAFTPLMEALFTAGAVDVYLQPIVMKKGRPAHCVVALADADHRDAVADTLFNQSSTIGLRVIPFEKRMLPRARETVETSLGSVTVKKVTQPDGRERWKVEHDDIVRAAAAADTDYGSARRTVEAEVRAALGAGKD